MHTLPYKRNIRLFKDNNYRDNFVTHKDYAESPHQYIRAFLLIQKDIQNLFDYIEPADINLQTFSFRIHELLMRTCIEVESNFKAILVENGFEKFNKDGKPVDLKISDYKRINKTHRLSSYEVMVPNWIGTMGVRKPFQDWKSFDTLTWYKIYNETKHDRHSKFHLATFDNLINSVCGLVAVLASQFYTNDLSPECYFTGFNGINDDFETAIGGYFRVKFPQDWPDSDKYDFDWKQLADNEKKIELYNYNK